MHEKSRETLLHELEILQQKYDSLQKLYDENTQTSHLAEQTLLENEANIKAIIENSLDSIWSIDRNYNIQYVNDIFAKSFFATFGIQLVRGVNILESLPVSLRDIWKERYDRAFNNEHFVFNDKIELENSNIYIEVAMNPVLINGQVVGASFFGKDISDRKNAEAALLESEERFKALHNASFGGISIHDKGIIIDCNQGLVEMTGYSRDELMGMDGLLLISTEWRETVRINIQQGLEKPYEVIGIRKNGESYPLLIEARNIPYKGKMVRITEFRDITQQKKAEEAFWESQTNFRALFEKGPIGVAYHRMVYDEYGNPTDFFFVDANKGYAQITGVDPIGKYVTEVFPGIKDDPFNWIETYGEVAKTGKELRFQQYFAITDRWYNIVAYQYKADHFVAAFFDITERMRAENALKISEEIFSHFMENSPIYVFFKDREIRSVRLSRNYEELLGKPMEELIGKNMYELFPNDLAKKMVEDDKRILQNGKVEIIEEIFNERYYSTIKFPIVIEGKPRYLAGYSIDITEQKKAEITLKSSEERLKILFNHAPEAYYLSDLKGNFVDGNFAAEKLLGYNKTELVGKNFFNLHLLSSKQLLKAAKLIAMNVMGKPTGPDEFVINTKNGNKVTVEITTHPVNIEGQILVLGIARDISDRKKTEKAMKMASENWNRTFQAMHSGIALLDAEQLIIQANRSFQNFTGLSEAELRGRNCYNLIFSGSEKAKENPFARMMESKVCETSEINFNGRVCELLVDPIFDTNGAINGAVNIINDITSRKRDENIQHILHEITGPTMFDKTIEELLVIVRHALSKVLDTTNFFVALHNPETDTLRKVIFEDEKDDFIEWDANKSLSGQILKRGTTLLLDSEGESRFAAENNIELLGSPPACWLGVPIMNKEFAIGVIVVQSYDDKDAYDMSAVRLLTLIAHELSIIIERKKMIQDLIAAKERAEESDRLKSAFLANMSHEIRTPMNGILGFADLLKQPRLTDEEQQLFVGIIEKSGERMLSIINDLINISKIESGQMDVWFSETNINEQIEFLRDFFTPEANQKEIKLITSCALPFSKSVINTDREKLYAVLTNLVKNAIKFTKKGTIEFGYQAASNHVLFFIKDTGIGIAANKQKNIFERFVQANSGAHNEYEGAGLGLSISKAYIEMLGGKIWFESEEGKGTSFYFTLPVVPKDVGERSQSNKRAFQIENENYSHIATLLIAEDDEVSSLYLTKILKSCKVKLVYAKTGVDAVKMCKTNPDIELVLMDINMPEMDGHQAAKEIKSFRPELIIIAQTAFALDEDKEKYIETFDGYTSKPIKADELKQKLRKYLPNTSI